MSKAYLLTLSEFIRLSRLSQAAFELQNNTVIRIIDLAVKYGYGLIILWGVAI